MLRLWLLLLLCLTTPLPAEPVESLRSPLPASHLADTLGLLASDTRAELDRLAGTLDAQNRGELAFVIVNNTNGMDPRQYALAVYNRWDVGNHQRNDGTLILLARDDRAAEILLGDGIDTPANRAHAQAVMDQEMVPRLRAGDPDQAFVAGTTALLQRIYGIDLARPSEAPVQALVSEAQTQPATPQAPAAQPATDASAGEIAFGLSVLIGVFGGGLWLVYRFLRMLWWFAGARWMARRCARCRSTMQLLDEVADDAHLSVNQRTEERLGSVDHKVFLCPGCGHIDKLARRAWFTRYADCSACQARALSSVSRTLSAPTRWSTGTAEVTSTCQHCGKVSVEQRTLPSVSSSSSSSSGGSGFGGGHSSGGGASGRW
ncbi:MAG: TPM domain-containing protein [Lysobacterales bacterium]